MNGLNPSLKEYIESKKTWWHKKLDKLLAKRVEKLTKEYYEKVLTLTPWE